MWTLKTDCGLCRFYDCVFECDSFAVRETCRWAEIKGGKDLSAKNQYPVFNFHVYVTIDGQDDGRVRKLKFKNLFLDFMDSVMYHVRISSWKPFFSG